MKKFLFNLIATDGHSRRGEIFTPHGTVQTPAFMPVGTQGTVKAMYPDQVRELGADVILGNTYHLMLRPTAERINRLGGLHKFANWPYTILTDSGGFQVMSLAKLRQISDTGVVFQSHLDGSKYELTPERSVEIQNLLGADIQMQLDECIKLPAKKSDIRKAMLLSLKWAEQSRRKFEELNGVNNGQGIFGIVQGGDDPKLRIESAMALTEIPFEGYSIGGLAVGEPQETMLSMLEVTLPALPTEKPRYLMGVGTPDDIIESIARGVDMFDCVMPSRAGRHGLAFTKFGKINLKNSQHAEDPRPLDPESNCEASSDYSRAYLHHLVKSNELLASMLITWNNLHYYQKLMQDSRAAIVNGNFAEFSDQTKRIWKIGDSKNS